MEVRKVVLEGGKEAREEVNEQERGNGGGGKVGRWVDKFGKGR